eukprot:173517_1
MTRTLPTTPTHVGKQIIWIFLVGVWLQYVILSMMNVITLNQIESKYNSNTQVLGDCLIIILSSTRAYGLTWQSFKRHMLDVTNCDLALCVGTYHENTSNPFYTHAKYIWTWNETAIMQSNTNASFVQLWEKSFEQLQIMANITVDNEWKKLFDIEHKDLTWSAPLGPQSHAGSGGILLFFRQFLYLKLKQHDLVHKYKYFIHTRSDYKYDCDFEYYHMFKYAMETKNALNKSIWISSGQEYGGITDRNLMTTSEYILDTLDVLLNVFTNHSYFYQRIQHRSGPGKTINIEKMTKFHFESKRLWNKVHKYHQVMYLVRGNSTDTRFSKGKYHKKEELFVKYDGELAKATAYCMCFAKERDKWRCMPVHPLDVSGDLRG